MIAKKIWRRSLVEAPLYIVFLAGSMIFVSQSLVEYSKGVTSYSIQNEDVLMGDLPTVTFCIVTEFFMGKRIDYGTHFNVEVSDCGWYSCKFTTLLENEYVETMPGIRMYLSRFWQTSINEKEHAPNGGWGGYVDDVY